MFPCSLLRRLRRAAAALSVAMALLLPCGNALAAGDKVSPLIVHQMERKRELAAAEPAEREVAKAALGLKARLGAEAGVMALYVDRELTTTERKDLAQEGIDIREGSWVPPVPGRHPRGFHVATVKYAALDKVRADARFHRAEALEIPRQPQNDLTAQIVNADDALMGTATFGPYTGAGVKVAVADSGCHLAHGDLPVPVEAYDVTDGPDVASWGTNVANSITGHGTHVSGTVLGNGFLSSGQYHGMAPGASFHFYKIGNDTDASASDADIILAINRALLVGCRIFSMSYGGFGTYMDGSEPMEQAIDAAHAAGMLGVFSAGNSQTSRLHASTLLAPATTSPTFSYTLTNPNGTAAFTGDQYVGIIWRDDAPTDLNVTLTCTNLGPGESLTQVFSGTSPRNTEARQYTLTANLASGTSNKTYTFQFVNAAASGTTPRTHFYSYGPYTGRVPSADPMLDKNYTLGGPSDADTAISVGAWVHRPSWTDWNGVLRSSGQTNNTLATFSSWGPRIDGVLKPDVVAPGSVTISLRDPVSTSSTGRIDNDGLNLNGSGPADYVISQGTSMAAPAVSGSLALIAEAAPLAGPADLATILFSTSSQAGSPNAQNGRGMINVAAAINSITPTVTIEQASGQADPTTVASVDFDVVFSAPVTGLTGGDFTIGGTAGATTAVVSGGPTTYTVTVSGVTGAGTITLSLPMGRAQSVAHGSANQPSTSADNSVTFNIPADVSDWPGR